MEYGRNSDIKVVRAQRVLHGSGQTDALQQVATVYIDGREYRVYAPSEARGPALEWVKHFCVRKWDGVNEQELGWDGAGFIVLKAVQEELEKQKHDENREVAATHPDGVHWAAQICLTGHTLHCDDGMAFDSDVYCTQCGAAGIHQCPHCNEPIRGTEKYHTHYSRPHFCHRCGKPYPWMQERLQTARELLYHDEKLTMDDRSKLFDLLKYVMSDPKGDLVPAKKKLIEIILEKATAPVREFILDLAAKTMAEAIKP